MPRSAKLRISGLLLALLILLSAACAWFIHDRGLPVLSVSAMTMGAGAGAKLACSGVYLQGRAPEVVVERDLRPLLAPLLTHAHFAFDAARATASASYFGLFKRTALYRPGLGCTLMIDTTRDELLAQSSAIAAPPADPDPQAPWPLGRGVEPVRPEEALNRSALAQAIDAAFAEDTPGVTIDTRALVVVHRGKLVAERYAPGFDPDSRFLAWSASKSVTSALIGTLVTDGVLALDAPAPIAAWRAPGDPRGAITLRQLLTMTDGLDFVEHPYAPGNDSTNMLFKAPDMAAYTASKPLAHPPGSHWSYSSGTTNLLSQIIFDAVGGDLPSLQRYVRERFFGPAAMHSAVFEVDVSGAQVGSSYFYATARDWARFGLLFLNKGMINGRQLLSPDYVVFATTPIEQLPDGRYGGQFWLNAGDPAAPEKRRLPDAPRDIYMAAGFNDEYIVVVPSRDTVIVRAGWTNGGRFDLNRHVAAILAALPTETDERRSKARAPELPAFTANLAATPGDITGDNP
ncbi:MAG: serine hydrolase domain-containing protein [Chromatocurvus sp.]